MFQPVLVACHPTAMHLWEETGFILLIPPYSSSGGCSQQQNLTLTSFLRLKKPRPLIRMLQPWPSWWPSTELTLAHQSVLCPGDQTWTLHSWCSLTGAEQWGRISAWPCCCACAGAAPGPKAALLPRYTPASWELAAPRTFSVQLLLFSQSVLLQEWLLSRALGNPMRFSSAHFSSLSKFL